MSDSEHSDIEENQNAQDLSDQKLLTKYTTAAGIANQAVALVMRLCVPGVNILSLCEAGDEYINDETKKIYNKGKVKIEKGIAFPTSISVNNIVGHFCPLAGNEQKIAEGDLVKVDLGVQIDGYIAVVAHTFKAFAVGSEQKDQIITGRAADVLQAAYTAAECAQRLLKAGNKNTQISDMISKVAADFKCNPVQGVISHQMSRFVIDGEKVILNKPDQDNKVQEIEFLPNEVYAMDIVMSSGDGKAKESEERTTIFKRSPDANYSLRMKASRQVFSKIKADFPTFPFTLRALEEKKALFGIVELQNHGLVDPYPVLYETKGEFIAHIKFTILVTHNSTTRITGDGLYKQHLVKSEHKVQNKEILAILNTSKGGGKKKKKKKKKKKS